VRAEAVCCGFCGRVSSSHCLMRQLSLRPLQEIQKHSNLKMFFFGHDGTSRFFGYDSVWRAEAADWRKPSQLLVRCLFWLCAIGTTAQ
ncbi:hypothetical protein STEG23_006276, partial [Scotinomys teguina]